MARLLKCLLSIFSFKLRSQKNVRDRGLTAIFIILSTWFIIIITSSDDIPPSTLITDQSPTGILLDIKVTGICFLTPYIY